MSVSSRHEGTLTGKLREFDPTLAVHVRLVVADGVASLASVQMTSAFLVNLISRFEGVLGGIEIDCPDNVPVVGRLSPLDRNASTLKASLESINAEIGVVPIKVANSSSMVLVVGSTENMPADLHVLGAGWCGGVRTTSFEYPDSALPFGPYIAACIGAAEIFKRARMAPERNRFQGGAFLSAWSNRVDTEPFQEGPLQVESAVNLIAALAGVGAVGSAYLHTIWTLPNTTGIIDAYDNDPEGVEDTNLNRYVLFGRDDLGMPKATQAAQTFASTDIKIHPHDSDVGSAETLPSIVLSAVDKNRARQTIQNRYPARILSASTQDLRAEVLSAGPPGVGACIRCFNLPEEATPDNQLYDRLLSDETLQATAAECLGEDVDAIRTTAINRQCSTTSERILAFLKRTTTEPITFAVSFVSALAGVLLASEHYKLEISDAPTLGGEAQWFTFQFFDPTSSANTVEFLPRDSRCPLCIPDDIGTVLWRRAYSADHSSAQAG